MLVLFGFLFWLIFPYPIKNIVVYLNPYYHYAMLFVLFAMLFPDARFFLMFIIPVRGKWMIFITLGLYLLDIVRQFLSGSADYGWFLIFMIFAAILNVVFFMLLSGYRIGKNNARQQQRYGAYTSGQNARNNASRIRPESQRTTRGPRHKCAVCGKSFNAEYAEVSAASLVIPAAHDPVYVEEIPATETENGAIAHFDCSVCGKHFRDEACRYVLTDADLVIPATGSTEPGIPAGASICKFCGQYHDSSVWGRVSSLVHLILYLVMRMIGKA